MKKLMMIVSSMAVACSVQAASMVWGFASPDIKDVNDEYMGDAVQGVAYLYLGTVTSDGKAFDTSSATLVTQAGQNANYQFGEIDTPVENAKVTSTADGQAYTLILVEDNGKGLDSYDGNYILFTGSSQEGNDPMSGAKWAVFTDPTAYGASDWSTMTAGGGGGGGGGQGGIPEPTSGLLLLVGGAMLALRRKQK